AVGSDPGARMHQIIRGGCAGNAERGIRCAWRGGGIAWLATQPDGMPFQPALLTVTALEGYFAHLEAEQRAPPTPAKALAAIPRFCRWAIDAGQLQRNPAHQIKRPTVPALSPTELAPEQRTVLKNLVERQGSLRPAAIFALGYWAGLRISEVATLRLDHCVLNQRAGTITIVGAKGGKTRTIDLVLVSDVVDNSDPAIRPRLRPFLHECG